MPLPIPSIEISRSVRNVAATAGLLGVTLAGHHANASASEAQAAALNPDTSNSRVIDTATILGPQALTAGGSGVLKTDTKVFPSVMVVMPDVKNDKSPIPASAFNANILLPVLGDVKKYVTEHADEKPIVSAVITGNASDPYRAAGTDAEIGTKSAPNTGNDLIAQNYSYAGKIGAMQISTSEGVQIADTNITLAHKQNIWSTATQHKYDEIRKNLGFANYRDLLTQQKEKPDYGSQEAQKLYDNEVTKKQGVEIQYSVMTTEQRSGGGTSDDDPSSSPTASPSTSVSPSNSESPNQATGVILKEESDSHVLRDSIGSGIAFTIILGGGLFLLTRRRNERRTQLTPPLTTGKVSLVRTTTKNLPPPPPGPIKTWNTVAVPPAAVQASQAPTLDPVDDDPKFRIPFLTRRKRKKKP